MEIVVIVVEMVVVDVELGVEVVELLDVLEEEDTVDVEVDVVDVEADVVVELVVVGAGNDIFTAINKIDVCSGIVSFSVAYR